MPTKSRDTIIFLLILYRFLFLFVVVVVVVVVDIFAPLLFSSTY